MNGPERLLQEIKGWKVAFCKRPEDFNGPGIILFPIQDDIINCGLAGFVIFKARGASQGESIFGRIASHVHSVLNCDIASILSGKMKSEDYLKPDALDSLEKDLNTLKQDAAVQYALCRGDGLRVLKNLSDELTMFISNEDALMEKEAKGFPSGDLETIASRMIALKDCAWSLREDILKNQDKILDLAGPRAFEDEDYYCRYHKINSCLNALDRLEVRGRDSAGLQLLIQFRKKDALDTLRRDLEKKGLFGSFHQRCQPDDLHDGSIHVSDSIVSFTYKTAQVTGQLGDNTSKLRNCIRNDFILKAAFSLSTSAETYLAHTRWASVGAINEINCHPVNSHTIDIKPSLAEGTPAVLKKYPYYGQGAWTVSAALNGDIDNYHVIKGALETNRRLANPDVTTDTKVIPMQIEKFLYLGHDLKESFRRAVNDFEGSHAIAMESNLEPGKVFLALKGSGQTIYVGLMKNGYMFASEIYGLVEETSDFIKMDGEAYRDPGNPGSQGQIFVLSDDRGPGLAGIEALSYDGIPLALGEKDISHAQITTRDINRGDHPHFLIKEIMDAPLSIHKTLLGKYRISRKKEVSFNLDEGVVSRQTRDYLAGGKIKNIFVIGQGTAAVAASAVAEAISFYLRQSSINVQSRKASELSGFMLDDDMSDTIVIAITQSGTTTDTNRAVTMAHQRGAHLIAIVNRRQSDITTKVDGVFYTSDGRDIEMSVASTKAFYSQIVAGFVLALFFAKLLKVLPDHSIAADLTALEKAPELMWNVIRKKEAIRKSAWQLVRKKQYWAVVGSGINKVASDEIRIKLSELCYKTISSDIIEDKKHIDLSSEPLILVCAAGSPEIVLEDIVKDVAIFKAHSASVVVITDDDEHRFDLVSDEVIHVPKAGFPLCVIFNTLAGHIWGYYAACSLDDIARAMKGFRTNMADVAKEQEKKEYTIYESMQDRDLHRVVDEFAYEFNTWRSSGQLASLSVEVASDISLLLKYAKGKLPVEDFWVEFQNKRVSSSPIDMLDLSLKRAIDELSRPVDAIRHQAKTVTVGTSRKTEVPRGPLFDVFGELGFSLENVRAKDVIILKRLQNAILQVKGYTLYDVASLDDQGIPTDRSTLTIVSRHGIAVAMRSRYDKPAPLKGTKNTIVRTGKVYAGVGRSDNAPIIIVPFFGQHRIITNLLLLHVDFNEELGIEQKKETLGLKLNDITNLINEYNIPWKDEFLEPLSLKYLLGEDVEGIVDSIKSSLQS